MLMLHKASPVISFIFKFFFKKAVKQHAQKTSIAFVNSMEKSDSSAEL